MENFFESLAMLIFLCLVYGYVSHRINKKKYSHIPGHKAWPIIGNLLDTMPYLTGEKTIQDGFLDWALQYGPLFKIWIGNKPWLIVSDPDMVKDVLLGDKFPKDPVYYSPIAKLYGQRFAGNGSAIQTNPDIYARQASINRLAYSKKLLSSHCSAIVSVTQRWIEKIQNMSLEGGYINLKEQIEILGSSSLCKVSFDRDVPFDVEDKENLHNMVQTCFQGIADKLFNPIGCTLYFKRMEQVRRAARNLRKVGEDFIVSTYDKIRNGEPLPNGMFSYVLQELHEAGGKFSLEEIVDEFIIQFVAGTETTVNLAQFIMLEITRHPNVYRRLQQEIDDMMAATSPENFFKDLDKMVYLEQVIKEVLRMYPIAVATTRNNYVDAFLGDYKIPANSTIMVNMYVLHRNPHYFENPDTFDPDRWAPDKPMPIPFTYIPFSFGMRGCVGRHLAKLETKIWFTHILHTFNVEPHPDTQYGISTTISIKPKHTPYFKFIPRSTNTEARSLTT